MATTNTMNWYTNGLTSPPPAASAGAGASAKPSAVHTAHDKRQPDSPPPCGEGLGVGGTTPFGALQSPPPRPSPTRGEGTSTARAGARGEGDPVLIISLPLQGRMHDLAVLGHQRAFDDLVVPVDLQDLLLLVDHGLQERQQVLGVEA